jgi:hypothetical protein
VSRQQGSKDEEGEGSMTRQIAAKDPVFQRLVDKCKAARKRFQKSEVDYFEFLHDVETNDKSIWGICGSFEDFIRNCVGRPEPYIYSNFREARKLFGIQLIRAVGVPAAIASLKIKGKKRRAGYLQAIKQWVKKNDGCHPSAQHSRTVRQQVAPVKQVPQAVRQMAELIDLRKENVALRQENERLKKLNVRLQDEVDRLRGKRAGRAQPSAAAPS